MEVVQAALQEVDLEAQLPQVGEAGLIELVKLLQLCLERLLALADRRRGPQSWGGGRCWRRSLVGSYRGCTTKH